LLANDNFSTLAEEKSLPSTNWSVFMERMLHLAFFLALLTFFFLKRGRKVRKRNWLEFHSSVDKAGSFTEFIIRRRN